MGMAILAGSQANAGIRCGNDLIVPGETSFDVRMKLAVCGSIISEEHVGTRTDTESNGAKVVAEERVVKRWYIRVRERGGTYCYPLTFEEGILTQIGGWRRCE